MRGERRRKSKRGPADKESLCGYLNMLGPGNGTIRRYGLVEVGVAFWSRFSLVRGNASLWGWALRPSPLAVCETVFSCLPLEQDVELSASPVPCLPGCCHVPTLMTMD